MYRNQETALDIRADAKVNGRDTALLIECKKNNPDFTQWIFFPKRVEQGFFLIPAVSPGDGKYLERVPLSQDLKIVDAGRETKASYSSKSDDRQKTKTSNSAISDAARQISITTHSLWTSEQAASHRKYPHSFILPVIVTTANLFICEFESKEINILTGEIPFDQAKLFPVERLVYEYAMPASLQVEFQSGPAQGLRVDCLTRQHIIVMNSSSFQDFLNVGVSELMKFPSTHPSLEPRIRIA